VPRTSCSSAPSRCCTRCTAAAPSTPGTATIRRRACARRRRCQGILNDLGNPKIAVFFTTLLPQFAPAHGPAFLTLLAFGLVFCAMTFAWLCAYSVAVARAGDALRRPRIRRTLDAVMGAALVAVGVRVAVERR
jgi:threonine/homoserine/homoserine lactone efflux protein